MNISNAILMYEEKHLLLSIQQILSLFFVFDAWLHAKKRIEM